MKTRKKWLRKTTAICTAALLGTAAIPSTAFAADSYASIEKDAWAKKVTEMASSYATSINGIFLRYIYRRKPVSDVRNAE